MKRENIEILSEDSDEQINSCPNSGVPGKCIFIKINFLVKKFITFYLFLILSIQFLIFNF